MSNITRRRFLEKTVTVLSVGIIGFDFGNLFGCTKLENTLKNYEDITKKWDPIYGPPVLRGNYGYNDFKGHLSDHIGVGTKYPGVDYDLFDEDMSLIEKTEGLYVYIGGDAIENAINTDFGQSSQIDVKLQYLLLARTLEKLYNKIVAVGTGNHPFWTEKMAGIDVIGNIVKNKKLLYTKNGGLLRFTVGDVLLKY